MRHLHNHVTWRGPTRPASAHLGWMMGTRVGRVNRDLNTPQPVSLQVATHQVVPTQSGSESAPIYPWTPTPNSDNPLTPTPNKILTLIFISTAGLKAPSRKPRAPLRNHMATYATNYCSVLSCFTPRVISWKERLGVA